MADATRPRQRAHLLVRLLMLLTLAFSVTAQPAAAQSILRDAETEALFNDMSRPLIEAAGLSPANVKIVLVHDRSINAFVASTSFQPAGKTRKPFSMNIGIDG